MIIKLFKIGNENIAQNILKNSSNFKKLPKGCWKVFQNRWNSNKIASNISKVFWKGEENWVKRKKIVDFQWKYVVPK